MENGSGVNEVTPRRREQGEREELRISPGVQHLRGEQKMQGQQRLESKGRRLGRTIRKERMKMSEANTITSHRGVIKDED